MASKLIYQNYLLKQVGIAPGPVSDEYCEKHVDMCFFKWENYLIKIYISRLEKNI